MAQTLSDTQIIWIQKTVCKHVQGRWGVVCHDSCNICVVKRILILEKNKTDLQRRAHYLWATLSFFLGQSSKHLRLNLSLEQTRFTVGCLDQGHLELELEQPEWLPHRCTEAEAELIRINWSFLCTGLRAIGSLDTLTVSFTHHLTWALGYCVWSLNSPNSSHILLRVHPSFFASFLSSFFLSTLLLAF